MHYSVRSSIFLTLLCSLSLTSFACSANRLNSASEIGTASATPAPGEQSAPASPAPVAQVPSAPDPYQTAINRASSAFNMSQSAQSQDDWSLVVGRWQQAIDLLEDVPKSNPNHATAQSKLSEYRRNLDYAERQASRTIPGASEGTVRLPAGSALLTPQVIPPEVSGSGSFEAPIVGRAGGTPVINVVFNGNQVFPMIVDTGASGTLITPAMATALDVEPVGQIASATASGSATFPVGYVSSIEVGGAAIRDVPVAVGNIGLNIGLLGHDFFGNFDLTFRENVVEFRAR